METITGVILFIVVLGLALFLGEVFRVHSDHRSLRRIAKSVKKLSLIRVVSEGKIEAQFGELKVDIWGKKSIALRTMVYTVDKDTETYIHVDSEHKGYVSMKYYGGENHVYVPYATFYEMISVYPQLLDNLHHTEYPLLGREWSGSGRGSSDYGGAH